MDSKRQGSNLDTVLIQCYEITKRFAQKKWIALALDLPEESLKSAKGDEQRIAQVIDILIDMACNFYAKSEKGIDLKDKELKKFIYTLKNHRFWNRNFKRAKETTFTFLQGR